MVLCSSLLGGHTEGCRGAGDVVSARTWSSESPEVVTALGMLSLLWGCTMWMQIPWPLGPPPVQLSLPLELPSTLSHSCGVPVWDGRVHPPCAILATPSCSTRCEIIQGRSGEGGVPMVTDSDSPGRAGRVLRPFYSFLLESGTQPRS